MYNSFTCLIKSKPIKQEVSRSVILPPLVNGVGQPSKRAFVMAAKFHIHFLAVSSLVQRERDVVKMESGIVFHKNIRQDQSMEHFSTRR